MKKLILAVVVLVAVGVGAGVYTMRRNTAEPNVTTQPLSRGDIVDTVGATGTLEAVETVDVGTQVSGVVQSLYADFNSIVRKGQVIARLDPSLIQTQLDQQSANVVRAQAELERLRVALADGRQKLERARELSQRKLIPQTELETAEVNVKSAEAQIRSSEAALTQARAQLNAQKVNLAHTVIEAPIDGIVISRNVDQGQTVAASMNAPTLYVIAADLTKMQVLANIDEADVGRMRPGQVVTFRVDAYPNDTFTGSVEQVRLQPAVVQNVVTYSTVIAVPNPDLKLKPGMTANVSIEIARKNDVLRVPNAALRFRPTAEMFAALNQEVPPELQRGGRGGFGARGQGAAQPGAGTPASPAQPVARGNGEGPAGGTRARGNGGRAFDPDMTPEERRKRLEERLAGMTPEERERFQARMQRFEGTRGAQAGSTGAPQTGARGGRGAAAAQPQSRTMSSGATTIDSLFGPLPSVETRGIAWLYVGKQLKMVRLRLGISDGTFTEIINDSELQPGTEVVINLTIGTETRTTPGQGGNQNPLMGPQRGRGPGGGGGRR